MTATSVSGDLRIDSVAHDFSGVPALAETSMQIRSGEFVAVVGPSGCGKSTLFNIVAGLLRPTQGTIHLGEEEITGHTGRMGYMLQKDLLLPWRTVIDNVLLGPRLRGRVSQGERRRAQELLDRYGLGMFANNYPHTLSGGMKQRAAMIRTMLFSQDTLLLDEPFGALDSQTRILMQEWLMSVWDEIKSTILFITHDIDEALFLADRVAVMSSRPGRIKEIVEVDLPRPRSHEALTTEAFLALKKRIFESIYEESRQASLEKDYGTQVATESTSPGGGR
jgi:ABC-type nitrate/sulfonate/bicarbonate transport system ATPase subunit